VLTLTLAAAAPLSAQVAADTGRAHHHKHAHKWLSYDAATNTVTFKLVAGRDHGPSRLNFNGYTEAEPRSWCPLGATS
jgi:hypothetical protein